MRNLATFLLILILLPFALAETEIFSGKVITDTDKEIDGEIFKFRYDDVGNKVFVQTPATNLIVANGECKSNNIFRVCINSANFSYKNITTYVYYYELDAEIYKLTGSLSTNSSVTLDSILQGEPIDLSVTIKNPTDLDATGIMLRYDFAPFQIIEAKGCVLNGQQMEWNGSLKPKYDKTCTATIMSNTEGEYKLIGNLSYFNGFDTEEKKTDEITITVLPHQLKVSKFVDNNTEVDKPFYLNFSLQNIHASEEISGLSTINLPKHVSLIKDNPVFDKNEKTLKRSFTLKPNQSVSYSLNLEKTSQGTEPIIHKFAYTIKSLSFAIESNTFVDAVSAQSNEEQEQATSQQTASQEQSNSTTSPSIQNTGINPVGSGILPIPKNGTVQPENQIVESTIIHEKEPRFTKENIIISGFAILTVFLILFIIGRRGRKKEGHIEDSPELKAAQQEVMQSSEPKTKNF